MILSNYSVINRNTVRSLGTSFTNPLAGFQPCLFPNWYCGEQVVSGETDRSAFNNGYHTDELGGLAWALSPKPGGLSSSGSARGSGGLSPTGNGGKNATASLTGSGTISSAVATLIVSAAASLSGSGGVSGATLQAFLQLAAAVSGTGAVSAAALVARGALLAAVTGSGGATGTATGRGALAADLTVSGGELSTLNVGEYVWAKLVTAGFTAEEVLRIVAAATAGKVSGAPGNPVFVDLDGTTDVITGVADSSGNRTSATYTP